MERGEGQSTIAFLALGYTAMQVGVAVAGATRLHLHLFQSTLRMRVLEVAITRVKNVEKKEKEKIMNWKKKDGDGIVGTTYI